MQVVRPNRVFVPCLGELNALLGSMVLYIRGSALSPHAFTVLLRLYAVCTPQFSVTQRTFLRITWSQAGRLMSACQDDNHLSVENRRCRLSSCLARKIRSQPRRFLFCFDSTVL